MSSVICPITMFQRSPCTKAEPFDFNEYLHFPEDSEPDTSSGELSTAPGVVPALWYPHMAQYGQYWALPWVPGPLDEPG
jgi:hypothetical protein